VNGQRHRYICATSGERQKPPASHNCDPPSTAASTAAIAPIPRPPTTSILTPASWSARIAPAWYAPSAPVPVNSRAVRRSGE
jgi:hypothetical protein